MFKFLLKNKDELYYMHMINYVYKECWKDSETEYESFLSVKKKLNKLKRLDKINHPFLFEFREKVNKVNTDNFLNEKYCNNVDKLTTEFYQYYSKLNKK